MPIQDRNFRRRSECWCISSRRRSRYLPNESDFILSVELFFGLFVLILIAVGGLAVPTIRLGDSLKDTLPSIRDSKLIQSPTFVIGLICIFTRDLDPSIKVKVNMLRVGWVLAWSAFLLLFFNFQP